MSEKIVMYRGDLEPPLSAVLTLDGEPVDLTEAASIRIIIKRGGAVIVDRPTTGTVDGVIEMPWQAADTAEAGTLAMEFEVTWPGARPQTFRPEQVIQIKPDYA